MKQKQKAWGELMRRGLVVILILSLVIVLGYTAFLNREVISELDVKGPFAGVFSSASGTRDQNTDVGKFNQLVNNFQTDTVNTIDYFFSTDFQFANISFVSSDKANNLYFIDKSMERVVLLNANHQVARIIKSDQVKNLFDGGIKYKNSVCLAAEVIGDDDGRFYVLYRILDEYGISVKKEVIVQYDPVSGQQTVYFQRDYEGGNTPIRTGRLKSIQIKGDDLFVFYMAGNEDNDVILYKINRANNLNLKEHLVFSLPARVYPLDIKGIDWGNIFYTTMNGAIYKVNSPVQQVPFYSGSKEKNPFFPWYIGNLPGKEICFADMLKGGIFKLKTAGIPAPGQKVFTGKDLRNSRIVKFSNIFVGSDGSIVSYAMVNKENKTDNGGSIVLINRDGGKTLLERAEVPVQKILYRWFVWSLLFISVILLCYALRIIYIEWMDKKVSLFLKQLIVFIPLFVIAILITSGIIYSSLNDKYEKEADQKLMMLAHIGSVSINGDVLARITKPEQYMQTDYKVLRAEVHAAFEEKADSNYRKIAQGLYASLYKVDLDNDIYAVLNYDDSAFLTPLEATKTESDQYLEVFRQGKIVSNVSRDSAGYWRYALGPVYDAKGKITGIFKVAMDMSGIEEDAAAMRSQLLKIVLITIVVIAVVVFFTSYYLSLALRLLRDSVSEIAAGNWETVVAVKTRDEVADLGEGFNSMSQHIKGYIDQVTRLSESYFRFVPQQFLNFLGKESILDVNLGDQVQKTMSVMFSHIRSFPSLSTNMTPEENFNFINLFLKYVGPAVRENKGMIDKYMGSGIMALFDEEPENAVKAAIGMRRYLYRFNEMRKIKGLTAIDIGIGIQTGPLMLGVIGEKARMEGTVISDNVNLASLLEMLTEKMGASILITEDVLRQIPKSAKYKYRSLGLVRIEGKKEPVQIFDVYEGDEEDDRTLKQKTKQEFEEGIRFYQAGRFYDARRKFVEVIRENRMDQAAKIYFLLCDEYSRVGSPEGWDGTLDTGKL